MNTKGTLVFDMDGTIADLYGVKNWLPMLRAENVTPYEVAEPMYDMAQLADLLRALKEVGYRIAVITWASMNASMAYKREIRKAKKAWLDRFNFPYDDLYCRAYGTPKQYVIKGCNQILFDDSDSVREAWTKGTAFDAKQDILPILQSLLNDNI